MEFIASRGITNGTGQRTFNPEGKLNRADCIVMIIRAHEIKIDENPTDNFSDAGNTYYTNYLATAKRLGLTQGIGNNKFAPTREITRQEMFVLLYNTLKSLDRLPPIKGDAKLENFSDKDSLANWAVEAISYLVQAGVIKGSNGAINPNAQATRAEMAQLLYSLLKK